jgi:F0F1-type ATP synthase assembly protein I
MLKKDNMKEFIYYFGLLGQIGFTIVFSILGGSLIGIFLDRVFDTSPVFVVMFILIGTAGGFYSVWKQINSRGKRDS